MSLQKDTKKRIWTFKALDLIKWNQEKNWLAHENNCSEVIILIILYNANVTKNTVCFLLFF